MACVLDSFRGRWTYQRRRRMTRVNVEAFNSDHSGNTFLSLDLDTGLTVTDEWRVFRPKWSYRFNELAPLN